MTEKPKKLFIEPEILRLAEDYVKAGSNKRAVAALKEMLKKGYITTDELNDLGYNHPPRAIADVRDAGIPVITDSDISERSGRRMAKYRLGSSKDIVLGRIGGRSALPKAFKAALIREYGSRDCITGAILPPTVLQIDHRIPFRVAGDVGLKDHDVSKYMLLDASSQRAKSWSCEACANFRSKLNSNICRSCYWANPESYTHIAMSETRRLDVTWTGAEVAIYDLLASKAKLAKTTPSELLKKIASAFFK